MNQMKCTRCGGLASIKLESHNSKFCPDCFDLFFLNSVRRGLAALGLKAREPVVVAVSGGKDSLTAWDVLARLGFQIKGLHLHLGVPGFSEASLAAAEGFAQKRGLELSVYHLEDIFGHTLPEVHCRTRRETCSVCGMLKRSLLNRLTLETGGRVLATGHHLDDEAGRLLGNLLRHQDQYLEKFYPFLPQAHPNQAARVKPLYRVDELEIRTYVEARGIKPATGPGCPFAKGATSRYYKEALAFLEEKMPGAKRDFFFDYLKNKTPPAQEAFGTCQECGQPTWDDRCALCRLGERLGQEPD